jgi:membrane protein required for colicin V production
MNTLDWIFIVILALLGVRCLVKGFITEVLSVASVLVGLLAGLLLYKTAAKLFVGWGLKAQPSFLPGLLGFVAIFAVGFVLMKIVESMIKEGVEAAELGGVDRFLGLILGLAEGLAIVCIILVAMSLLEPSLKSIDGYSKLLSGSAFARVILPIIGPEVAKATQGIKLDAPDLKQLQLKTPQIKKP